MSLSDTLGWTRGCSIPGQRPPCPLPLPTRELLHVIASWQAASEPGLVGYMSQTMRKLYPARGKCLNYEAGMRRVTVGNGPAQGPRGCWFPFRVWARSCCLLVPISLSQVGKLSSYPSLAQNINVC